MFIEGLSEHQLSAVDESAYPQSGEQVSIVQERARNSETTER